MKRPDKQKICKGIAKKMGVDINEDLSPVKTLEFDYLFHVEYTKQLERYVEKLERKEAKKCTKQNKNLQ